MRIIAHNWRLKLAALFIAASTWGVVAYANNPVSVREFPRVPIQAGPLANPNWVMVTPLPPVSISLSGLQQGLNGYDPKNLRALVDLTQARVGINRVRVQVDGGDPSITVTRIVPDRVAVVLDEKDVVTKKVAIRFKSSPNICCVAPVDAASASPDSVRVSGPRSLLARVTPYVDVDLTEARSGIKLDQWPVKLDGGGAQLGPLVTVSPTVVSVTVPVTVVHKSVQAFVKVVEQGQVAPGYELGPGPVRVTPDIVTLEGDPNIVGPISSIETETINLNGATSDIIRTVALRPPAGVTVVGAASVVVRITVSPVAAPTPAPSASPSPSPSPTR